MERTLPSKEAITLPRWDKINKVIGDNMILDNVLPKILPCTDVHSLVDLTRVSTQDLSA